MDAIDHVEVLTEGAAAQYGTDAIVIPHGENFRQMQDFIDAGMDIMQVIQSATINAAEALGSNDVGVIEAGRFADFVAIRGVSGMPEVADFGAIDVVVKGGKIVDC